MKHISRRQFLSSALLTAGTGLVAPKLAAGHQPIRTLGVETRTIEVAGRAATVFGIVDSNRSSPFRFALDEPFEVQVENRLMEPTLLHWHGLTPPWRQDGVPSLPHPPIEAGSDHGFSFALDHPGTFWMHSHFELQLQGMFAAPLIVSDPAETMNFNADIVVMLQDFSFRPAEEILAGLVESDSETDENMSGMDHGNGTSDDMPGMADMTDMADMPPHANDVDYDAYLTNERSLDDPEVVTVERGARIRLRVVNAAAATAFHIDTGALAANVLAVDGVDVTPVTGQRFPLSPGQRLDLAVSIPDGGGTFPILALREGATERTGLVLATVGAPVSKISPIADKPAPLLDLSFERRLVAALPETPRPADRRLEIDLIGSHEPYRWGIAAAASMADQAISVGYGEQIEITFNNPTAMSHPMHLHGHRFQIVGIGKDRFAGALRDTILVPSNTTVTIAFEANNPGRWALHCHHLYHMAAGMMTTLDYRGSV